MLSKNPTSSSTCISQWASKPVVQIYSAAGIQFSLGEMLMKAVVFHGIGDIRLDEVKDPNLQHDFDAVVQITASAICGTDLHFVRGTVPDMKPGTILGH